MHSPYFQDHSDGDALAFSINCMVKDSFALCQDHYSHSYSCTSLFFPSFKTIYKTVHSTNPQKAFQKVTISLFTRPLPPCKPVGLHVFPFFQDHLLNG